ncbi:MAG: hypothetical protein ACK4PI_08075 [Tepidisphaerales bacterium]
MQTADWVVLGISLMLARGGGLLMACGSGRARFAATAAWRSVLELAVVTVAVALAAAVVTWWSPQSVPQGGTPLLAGAVLAASLLSAPAGERTRTRWTVAVAVLYGLLVAPLAVVVGAAWVPAFAADVATGWFALTLTAGWVSLLAVLLAGPREGRFHRDGAISLIPPHQQPLVVAGLLVLWAGWLGSAVPMTGSASPRLVLQAGLLTTAAAVLGSTAYGRWRFQRIDVGLLVPGGTAGILAGMSLGPVLTEDVGLPGAVMLPLLLGLLTGAAAAWLHLQLERRLRADDLVGTVAGFLAGPLLGTLAAATFAEGGRGLFSAAFAAALYTAIAVASALAVLGAVRQLTDVRIDDAAEYEGLDLTQLDLNAYPDFQQPMIRSSHLREV